MASGGDIMRMTREQYDALCKLNNADPDDAARYWDEQHADPTGKSSIDWSAITRSWA